MKVLIVEDEPKVAQYLKNGLEENGLEANIAYDGTVGKSMALSQHYDVLILDGNLPNINGFDLCAQLRRENVKVPVLMLTALETTDDKLRGFEAGADDYLVKPFEFRELLARLRALHKRGSELSQGSTVLKTADLDLDLASRTVRRSGKEIKLTTKEFQLLEYLLRNKGKVVSRVDISEKVWEINFDTGSNMIDVYVTYLRRKIDRDFEPKLIHTMVGMGYMLKDI